MVDYSIIIPVFNKGRLLARSVRSALRAAKAQDVEIVIVDDGSTDAGAACASDWGRSDPRIRVIVQANQGAAAARNRGVAAARGSFVLFLDADDEWTHNHLDVMTRLIAKFPSCGMFATAYGRVWPDGSVRRPNFRHVPTDPDGGILESYFKAAQSSAVWTSATCLQRDVFERVGGFPEDLRTGQDIVCWARAAAVAPVAWSPQITALYHQDTAANFSSRWRPEQADMVIGKLEELERDPAVAESTRKALADYCRHRREVQFRDAKRGGFTRDAWRVLKALIKERGLWRCRFLALRFLIPRYLLSLAARARRSRPTPKRTVTSSVPPSRGRGT